MHGEDNIESGYGIRGIRGILVTPQISCCSCFSLQDATGGKCREIVYIHGKPAGMYEHLYLIEMQGENNIESGSGIRGSLVTAQIPCCFSLQDATGGKCRGIVYTENRQECMNV